MVKKKDLRNMGNAELKTQLKELEMELMKSNSQVASGSAPKNPGKIRQTKKTIARILTILKEKGTNEKAEEKKPEPEKAAKAEKKEEKKKEESKKDE
jgi:large subunit ribosomal protein L29